MEYCLTTEALCKNLPTGGKALHNVTMHVPKGHPWLCGKKTGPEDHTDPPHRPFKPPRRGGYTSMASIQTRLSPGPPPDGGCGGIPGDLSGPDRRGQSPAFRPVCWGCPRRRGLPLLELVGLGETGRKKARNFSLGMRQRLGIAVALCGEPDFPGAG